jgi:eukaryotic-like serine/threonine-protein kinase
LELSAPTDSSSIRRSFAQTQVPHMTDINLLGRTLGPFEIIEELGRGGMAVVYKARQTDLQRTVALKILPPTMSLDKSSLQRFVQEARSAAALEHPHIVPIYAVGQAEGFHYITMKYIAGKTLKDIVHEREALEIQDAATMLEQVADALDYAHSEGVIHRDIKPSNMMAEKNGWVYLTDFGLARGGANSGLTMAGTVMGTPEYMSPEQAQGLATIGPPTDIYALGVVLYEMLTGQMPFQADTPMGMLVARLQYAPRPPRDYRGDLPMPVEDVIMRALARKPEARFGSAKELITALKIAGGLGTRSFAPQQRLASPPLGTPTAPPQPVSPAFGLPSTPPSPPNGTPPAASSAAGLPATPARRPAVGPTEVLPAQNTPPYVIPAGGSTAGSAPRTTTSPAMPAPRAPDAAGDKPRSRRGMYIAIGVIAAVLAGAFLLDALVLNRVDSRIAQGIQNGDAALAQKGGMNRAIESYKQVLAADPNNVVAHTRLALIYSLRDRRNEAEQAARAAITADDKAALAHAILAEVQSNRGDYDNALETADKAIELNSKLAFGYGARSGIKANLAAEGADADMMAEAGADADKAIELANKDDKLDQALAHSARGFVYWQEYTLTNDQTKVERGRDEFNKAIALQGQIALFHSNLGYFYDAQLNHDLAKEKFEAALDADDQYGHAHAGLGWNLYYLKDYSGALGEFDKALEINSEDSDAYVGKSWVYQYQEAPDYDKAIEALTRASAIAPNSPSIFSNLGWANRNRAFTYEYASDQQKSAYAEAEAQFRAALDHNERYVDALTGLGWVLQDQADVLKDDAKYQESIDTLKQALDIKQDLPYANGALGWSYYGLEQYDDAKESFDRAIELQSDYADAYYGLGRVLESQGKAEDARQAYQSAVEYGSQRAQEALDALK